MALLTVEDIQSALNIDLTDPNGQEAASSLIAAAVAWVETYLGYPLEEGSRTSYFTDGYSRFWLPTRAPVSNVVISTYDATSGAYDSINADLVRASDSGEVDVAAVLPSGFQAVKASYTSGWTALTLPRDLRQALIDMIGIKLLEVANYSSTTTTTDEEGAETTTTPTGAVKRVQADSYSVEYSTAQSDAYWKARTAQLARSIGDNLPQGIIDTIDRYRRPFAI